MDRRELLIASAAAMLASSAGAQGKPRGSTLRIGALVPLSGAGGAFGAGMRDAMLIAADEVNAAGGVHGQRMELLVADCETNPAKAQAQAEKLIAERVVAIVGTWASSVSLAVMRQTEAAGLMEMNVSGAPGISTDDKKDLVWRFHPTQERFGEACAVALFQMRSLRPAFMGMNNATGQASLEGFRRAWRTTGGTIAAEILYDPAKKTFEDEVRQLLAARPNVVVLGSYAPDMTAIYQEYLRVRQDQELSWVAPVWAANEDFLKAVGKRAAEGVVTVSAASNEHSPAYTRFLKKFEQRSGTLDLANIYAPMCFDMVQLIAMSALKAGPKAVTPIDISARLREISNKPGQMVDGFASARASILAGKKVDYDGASGRLNFDHLGDTITPFVIRKYVNGEQVRQRLVRIDS